MSSWSHSDFLNQAPNLTEDHRYLTRQEIQKIPVGVFYKKKDVLTRHRFIKFILSRGGEVILCEAVDDRGFWRINTKELERIAIECGVRAGVSEIAILGELGLQGVVLPSDVEIPRGNIGTPESRHDIERLYADYTDMHAQGHFDQDSPDLDRLELLTSWVPDGARTLDLGCNSGAFGAALLTKNCEVHGVDLSYALVEEARGRGVNAIRCWAEDTPYPAEMFGAVICAELLEHALNPLEILVEARRVLISGGILVGSVPHAHGPWGHEDMGHHPEHLWALEQSDLERMFDSAGFTAAQFLIQTHGTAHPIGLAFKARAA
ncbi:class I SAM-dependent methyltransferase [Williamsia soli]|uniref:class I SAM-dependent methyltransferase n=1 Tax=Williamsia soli TaxID=364929 RepID=UPI001A9FC6A3|nr:methyltransferase domain-containing protein [Williamsia soli]